MTLTVADTGEKYVIKRISGKPDVKQHLKNLWFVVGTMVSVMNASAAMSASSSRDATHKTYH